MTTVISTIRLKPTKSQRSQLRWMLNRCCDLHNYVVNRRNRGYAIHAARIVGNRFAQINDPTLGHFIPSNILLNVIKRFDETSNDRDFFDRPQPRRYATRDYDSFICTSNKVWSLSSEGITLKGVGRIQCESIRIQLSTVAHAAQFRCVDDSWYVDIASSLMTSINANRPVGIDFGTHTFMTLSNGKSIIFDEEARVIAHRIRTLKNHLREDAFDTHILEELTRQERRFESRTDDFFHDIALKMCEDHDLIAIEDIRVFSRQFVPITHVKRSWARFIDELRDTANGDILIITVDPWNTSQRCSECGAMQHKKLEKRWHVCKCGASMDRDLNAARNVLHLAMHVPTRSLRPTKLGTNSLVTPRGLDARINN